MYQQSLRGIATLQIGLALGLGLGLNPTSADELNWPHWRGPARNGLSPETSGWNEKAWPPQKPAWSRGVGAGASSPLVVGDRVFVMGWRGEQDVVSCLDATSGRELWKAAYKAPQYGR